MTTNLKAKGYVIFCKSRAGNKQFFEWFNNKVVFEFISSIRDAFNYNTEDHPCYVTFDGEKLQINGYKSDEMVNLF